MSCARCSSPLLKTGFCDDKTCPFYCHAQSCALGWVGHPNPPQVLAPPGKCSCRSWADENLPQSQEPWRIGRPGTVVSNTHVGSAGRGHDDTEYYGGFLICESITHANAARIIACVNACAGLSEEEIRDAIAAWRKRPPRNIIV